MNKGIIYYTDNRIEDPIKSVVRKYIQESGLPITSCSLKPIDFGENVVVKAEPSYMTYLTQMTTALEVSESDYVFFCEHDVLYPKSHFDFEPMKDNIFYYNSNVWRWLYGSEFAITYDRLISLSGLCVNRNFAFNYYHKRMNAIRKRGFTGDRASEPQWARIWGNEPGTKKRKRGGFSDDDYETWWSVDPIVDIRHDGTLSKTKVTLDSFKHQPKNWKQIYASQIPGWNLKEVFA